MAETLGKQYDPILPSALCQSSARKPLPTALPSETRVIRPEEEHCPACGGDLSLLGCDASEQLEIISSAFTSKAKWLSDARNDQQRFYQQTGGQIVPIIQITLPSTASGTATFTYSDADQWIK